MLFCFSLVLSSDIWLIINLDKQQGQSCCSDWLGKNCQAQNNDSFVSRQNECQTLPKFVACSIKTDAIKLMHYGGRALTYKSEVMFPWGGNASQYECFQMLLQRISPISFPSASWHLWDHIYVLRATCSLSMLRFANRHLAQSTSQHNGSIISFRGI